MKPLRTILMLPLLVSVIGCASKSGPSDNSTTTSTSDSGVTTLRTYRETQLPNGLKVLFLPDQSLPALSLGLLIRAGAATDPNGQAGLANFVSDLLDQGTKRRNANQIADDLGRIGASFNATVDYDYSYLSLAGLSFSSNELLANFVELATEPAFPDIEITRTKKQTMAGIERSFDNPRVVADVAANQSLYGSHPYGRSVVGSLKQVSGLTKKNVIQHYLRYYRPNNSILVVIGKFDDAFQKKVETAFGAWSKREVPKVQLASPEAKPGLQVRVVEKPDLTQAQIRIAGLGIKRQDKDFMALLLANTILGGAFASRLNDKIRKELGLTYSINSSFDSRLERGPFEISTFTKAESVGKVVDETVKLYRGFISGGVTGEELKRAKGYLKGIFPQAIETSDKLGFNLVLLRLYGIPDRYLTHYIHDLDDVSVSEVNAAIRRNMKPDDLVIVVHAPKETAESLKTINPSVDVAPVSSLQ